MVHFSATILIIAFISSCQAIEECTKTLPVGQRCEIKCTADYEIGTWPKKKQNGCEYYNRVYQPAKVCAPREKMTGMPTKWEWICEGKPERPPGDKPCERSRTESGDETNACTTKCENYPHPHLGAGKPGDICGLRYGRKTSKDESPIVCETKDQIATKWIFTCPPVAACSMGQTMNDPCTNEAETKKKDGCQIEVSDRRSPRADCGKYEYYNKVTRESSKRVPYDPEGRGSLTICSQGIYNMLTGKWKIKHFYFVQCAYAEEVAKTKSYTVPYDYNPNGRSPRFIENEPYQQPPSYINFIHIYEIIVASFLILFCVIVIICSFVCGGICTISGYFVANNMGKHNVYHSEI